MARFLVFGSVGWDCPVWLDQPLDSGRRILAFRPQPEQAGLREGRLGGGAANAAAGLVNAGHDAAVWGVIPNSPVSDQIENALSAIGIDYSFLKRADLPNGTTLILIEPSGERTIMFEHSDPNLDRSIRRMMKQNIGEIQIGPVQVHRPDGLFLRALFKGFEGLAELESVPIVAHWPQSKAVDSIPADVLIGSKDDLIGADLYPNAFHHGRKACTRRLQAVIVTDGPRGGEVFRAAEHSVFESIGVQQVDATGAGDSFAAGVLDALASGAPIEEAAAHGARWGAMTASLPGSAEKRAVGTYKMWTRENCVI